MNKKSLEEIQQNVKESWNNHASQTILNEETILQFKEHMIQRLMSNKYYTNKYKIDFTIEYENSMNIQITPKNLYTFYLIGNLINENIIFKNENECIDLKNNRKIYMKDGEIYETINIIINKEVNS